LGQLGGDSDAGFISVPVPVRGLTSSVTAVSVGATFTCALTTAGGVECWGSNDSGQLGNFITVSTCSDVFTSVPCSRTPLPVIGLTTGVTAVSAGDSFACAITAGGGVECWGNNSYGQLGNDSTTNSTVPVPVAGLTSGVTAVSAGGSFACAVTTTGGVECWGANLSGNVGIQIEPGSSATSVPVPASVTGFTTGVTAVSAGQSFACAVTTTGGVECWGADGNGQLGNLSESSSFVPVQVEGLTTGVTVASAGKGLSACALTAGGAIECWGDDTFGALGNGSTGGIQTSPVPVVTAMANGGETGDAGSEDAVAGDSGSADAVAGDSGSADAVAGDSGSEDASGASEAATPVTATVVSVGGISPCLLTSAGGVDCWGYNDQGQLGNDFLNSFVPRPVSGLPSDLTAVSAGGSSACALTAGGGVLCWGGDAEGKLGNDSTTNSVVPVPVSGLTSGVTALAVGSLFACAVTSAGAVECWGFNNDGELGDNSSANSSVPVQVLGLTGGATAVSAGGDSACAITTAGGVQCWGAYTGAAPVPGLSSGVTAVSVGNLSACA
jgi:alpha-tubulin suppressor-like RCC1 family protein